MKSRIPVMAWAIALVATAAHAEPEIPEGPCTSGPLILVRGVPQHVATTQAEVRAFLGRETGDSPPESSQYFQLRNERSAVRTLRFLPDASGGLILPEAPCADQVTLKDAEVRGYMLALLAKLQSLRTLPAEVSLVDIGKALDHVP
jgi:hypothetical protein